MYHELEMSCSEDQEQEKDNDRLQSADAGHDDTR